MPRYKVKEQRMYEATYIIEAEDEQAAARLEGNILDEETGESWGYDTVSVELDEGDSE